MKTLEELEQELYHSNFRIRKYKQRNEFDATEREEVERDKIVASINELKNMTPIDLLIERLAENGILHSSDISEANELFKKYIINAFNKGFITDQWDKTKENKSEQYYNDKFKQI